MRFDEYGNVVGNVYIRKVERKDGKLVNAVVKTYPDVSQFWTYKPEEFLKQPVYSRDFRRRRIWRTDLFLHLPADSGEVSLPTRQRGSRVGVCSAVTPFRSPPPFSGEK